MQWETLPSMEAEISWKDIKHLGVPIMKIPVRRYGPPFSGNGP